MNRLKHAALFRQACYINGRWVETEKTIPVTNPASQTVLGTIPSLTAAQVDEAIEQAHAAMVGWSQLTAKARSIILRRWFELIEANIDDLGLLMTLEQGKPLHEAKAKFVMPPLLLSGLQKKVSVFMGKLSHKPLELIAFLRLSNLLACAVRLRHGISLRR